MPYTRSRDRVLDPAGRVVGHCYGRTNADRLCSELNRLLRLIPSTCGICSDPSSVPPVLICEKCKDKIGLNQDAPLTTNCTRCGAPSVFDLATGLCTYCLVNEDKKPTT